MSKTGWRETRWRGRGGGGHQIYVHILDVKIKGRRCSVLKRKLQDERKTG